MILRQLFKLPHKEVTHANQQRIATQSHCAIAPWCHCRIANTSQTRCKTKVESKHRTVVWGWDLRISWRCACILTIARAHLLSNFNLNVVLREIEDFIPVGVLRASLPAVTLLELLQKVPWRTAAGGWQIGVPRAAQRFVNEFCKHDIHCRLKFGLSHCLMPDAGTLADKAGHECMRHTPRTPNKL